MDQNVNLEPCQMEEKPQKGVWPVWSVSPQALGTVEVSEQIESSYCRVLQVLPESIHTQWLEERQFLQAEFLLPEQSSTR